MTYQPHRQVRGESREAVAAAREEGNAAAQAAEEAAARALEEAARANSAAAASASSAEQWKHRCSPDTSHDGPDFVFGMSFAVHLMTRPLQCIVGSSGCRYSCTMAEQRDKAIYRDCQQKLYRQRILFLPQLDAQVLSLCCPVVLLCWRSLFLNFPAKSVTG